MNFVEVLECRRQLRQDGPHIAEVHSADVVALERIDEAFCHAVALRLHTGVITGVMPSDRAMCLVSCAM